MADDVLGRVCVGDSLCIRNRLGASRIVSAERVTPTQMVVTKVGVFNKDGTLRGERDTWWNRTRATPATEDDIAGIYRAGIVLKVEEFRGWDKLSADDLKAVGALVDRYSLKP